MSEHMQAQAGSTVGDLPASGRRWSRPLSLVAFGVTLLLGATGALWAYYGTAVFYETILAGMAACF